MDIKIESISTMNIKIESISANDKNTLILLCERCLEEFLRLNLFTISVDEEYMYKVFEIYLCDDCFKYLKETINGN